jgi:hypothetical protein
MLRFKMGNIYNGALLTGFVENLFGLMVPIPRVEGKAVTLLSRLFRYISTFLFYFGSTDWLSPVQTTSSRVRKCIA